MANIVFPFGDIVYEYWQETTEWFTWTSTLHNRCYMVVFKDTRYILSRPSNEFMCVWSMFPSNTCMLVHVRMFQTKDINKVYLL